MVKQKARYLLIQILQSQNQIKIEATQIFRELIKLVGDMHGDYGFAAVKASITVKLADLDIFIIKIETSVETFVTSALPFLVSIMGTPIVCRTLFSGRSMRASEKALIRWRRKELYCAYATSNSESLKSYILEQIDTVSGKQQS